MLYKSENIRPLMEQNLALKINVSLQSSALRTSMKDTKSSLRKVTIFINVV
jgi:hypothetical protein